MKENIRNWIALMVGLLCLAREGLCFAQKYSGNPFADMRRKYNDASQHPSPLEVSGRIWSGLCVQGMQVGPNVLPSVFIGSREEVEERTSSSESNGSLIFLLSNPEDFPRSDSFDSFTRDRVRKVIKAELAQKKAKAILLNVTSINDHWFNLSAVERQESPSYGRFEVAKKDGNIYAKLSAEDKVIMMCHYFVELNF